MSIKIVIFDLDGTLMDAYQAVEVSVNYTMQQLGLDAIDSETIKRSVGWGEEHLMTTFVGASYVEQALEVYREHHTNALQTGTQLLPGAKEILDHLKNAGYKICVASNRPSRFSKIAIRYLQIEEYFDLVLCADQVAHPKPAPDLLVALLERFLFKPQEALYVGDMTIDVETGKGADVNTVVVLTGSSTREEILSLDPYKIVSNVFEVAKILEELNYS